MLLDKWMREVPHEEGERWFVRTDETGLSVFHAPGLSEDEEKVIFFQLAEVAGGLDVKATLVQSRFVRLYRFLMGEPPKGVGRIGAYFGAGGRLRGRPPGSLESFIDKKEFIESVRVSIAALRRQGQPRSMERVAEYLLERGKLHAREHDPAYEANELGDPARQLRRLCRAFGYGSWEDVLRELPS